MALRSILERFGVRDLTVNSRVEASQDLAVPSGWRPNLAIGSPESQEAWLRVWLDERLPALGDLTPRQATRDPRGVALLERLLRRLEFDADAARLEGKPVLDVASVRVTLGDGESFGISPPWMRPST